MIGIDVVAFAVVAFAACVLVGMIWEDLKGPDHVAKVLPRGRRVAELSGRPTETFSSKAALEARGAQGFEHRLAA